MNDKIFMRSTKSREGRTEATQSSGLTGMSAGANGQMLQNGALGPNGVKRPEKKDNFRKREVKPANLNTLEGLYAQIQKLAKNLANPKDKEKYLELKERHYREFLMRVNKSNGVESKFPIASFCPYKYYIGRGNNSILVRAALKQRFWWSLGDYDNWEDYNFMWTQWKSNKILSTIKTHKDTVKEKEKAEGESTQSTQATDKESGSSSENLINTPKRIAKNGQQLQSVLSGKSTNNNIQSAKDATSTSNAVQ